MSESRPDAHTNLLRWKDDMPTAQELGVFSVLMAVGSITEAAEDLHLSQSQLSRILRRLEKKLEVTLFRRSTAGLRPTPEGRMFARTADALRKSYQQSMRQFHNEVAGDSGEVRLAILPSVAFEFLGAWTEEFRRTHPSALITAFDDTSGNALAQLHEGSVDVAISACLLRLPDGSERPLFPEISDLALTPLITETFALVSPAVAEVPSEATWEFALDQGTVGFTPRASVHRCLTQIAQREGLAFQPENLTNSPLAIAGLVESGLGSAIVPESNLAIMRIRNVQMTPLPGYKRIVCVATAKWEQTRLVRHFVEQLTM